jgi:hypothetical protein
MHCLPVPAAPSESKALAQMVGENGGAYIEAPVLGSLPEVEKGTLQIMVSVVYATGEYSNHNRRNYTLPKGLSSTCTHHSKPL